MTNKMAEVNLIQAEMVTQHIRACVSNPISFHNWWLIEVIAWERKARLPHGLEIEREQWARLECERPLFKGSIQIPELQPFGPIENSRNFVGNILSEHLWSFCKGPHSENYLFGVEPTEVYTVYTVFNVEHAIFKNWLINTGNIIIIIYYYYLLLLILLLLLLLDRCICRRHIVRTAVLLDTFYCFILNNLWGIY